LKIEFLQQKLWIMDAFQFRCFIDGERVPWCTNARVSADILIFMEQVDGGVDGGEESSGEAQITLKVKMVQSDQEEIKFKVRKTPPFLKIFTAYADKMGLDVDKLRFVYDGVPLKKEETPKMREMDDEDQIDCFLPQLGGGDAEPEAASNEDTVITLKVVDSDANETAFKVKKNKRFVKHMLPEKEFLFLPFASQLMDCDWIGDLNLR